MFNYYLDRSSPILVNFDSRGVIGAALPSGMYAASEWMSANGIGGHLELGSAELFKAVCWDLHFASLLTHLFLCLFCVVVFLCSR